MKFSVIIHQRLQGFIKIKRIVVSSIWSIRGKIKKSAGTFISPRLFIVQTSTLINSQTPWDIRYPKENKYPDPFPCKKCIAVGLHSFIYSIFFWQLFVFVYAMRSQLSHTKGMVICNEDQIRCFISEWSCLKDDPCTFFCF